MIATDRADRPPSAATGCSFSLLPRAYPGIPSVSTIWLIKVKMSQLVIASEAKQSSMPFAEPWIASSLRSSQ
jgi:hypothetical protein